MWIILDIVTLGMYIAIAYVMYAELKVLTIDFNSNNEQKIPIFGSLSVWLLETILAVAIVCGCHDEVYY